MGDKRSKIVFLMLGGLALLSIAATYYNTMVLRNFEVIDDLDEEYVEEE